MNDFGVAAWGALTLTPNDMIQLNPTPVEPTEGRPKLIIGAGTGLGSAFLTSHNKDYQVWEIEGGHTDWGPANEL
jgi:glucokinase